VNEVRDERPEIEVPSGVAQAEEDGAFRGVGAEDLVEDGLEKEGAEGVKYAYACEKRNPRKPVEPIGKPEAQEAERSHHAAGTALIALPEGWLGSI